MKTIGIFLSVFVVLFLTLPGYSQDTSDRFDMLKQQAYVDSSEFVTKKDFEANKDIPNLKGVKAGPVLFHGLASEIFTYDSNVYLAPDGLEKSDFIYDTNLGGSGVMSPGQDAMIGLGYSLEDYSYDKYSSEDHTDQYLTGLAELQLTDYTLTFRDLASRYSMRSGEGASTLLKRDDNEARLDLTADYDRLAFTVGATERIEKYKDEELLSGSSFLRYSDKSNTRDFADLQISYRAMPKTSFLVEGVLGQIDYDSRFNPEADYYEILGGVKGELTSKLNVYVKLGYKEQTYDRSAFVNAEDYSGSVYRGGVEFLMSERNIFKLALVGNIYDSIYADISYYVTDYAGLTWMHIFNSKIASRLYTSYQVNDYTVDPLEREDKSGKLGGSLRYYVRQWLSTEIFYERLHRDSNISAYEFTEDWGGVKITAGM
jgi:hypothetical protein